MSSEVSPLPLREWTHPYDASRSVNAENRVIAHPTSTDRAQKGIFICQGCEITREVTVVTASDLNEELDSMYPWMLTSTKTYVLTREGTNEGIFKHISTTIGYMCRGCTFFFKKTGLNIRAVMEDRSIQLFKIEKVFTMRQNQSVIVNVESDINPLTYLDHLRSDSTYEALFQLEGDILQIIEEQRITTLPQLVAYARNQTNQPS